MDSDEEVNISRSRYPVKQTGRKFWTESESAYLVLGVKIYGKGDWATIKQKFGKKLADRTVVQLKDRYRTLQNLSKSEYTKFEKIADDLYKSYC